MSEEKVYLISDASKRVQVESHVLRYWEEELKLPIKRNEMGHRYYTEEDIHEFLAIKHLKEQGMQLKAIRMILNEGKLIPLNDVAFGEQHLDRGLSGDVMADKALSNQVLLETDSQKAKRFQNLFRRMMMELMEENNEKMMNQISESINKELDYQFRMQEEREEQRENRQILLEEEHYRQLDDLLRNYIKKGKGKKEAAEKQGMKKGMKRFKRK